MLEDRLCLCYCCKLRIMRIPLWLISLPPARRKQVCFYRSTTPDSAWHKAHKHTSTHTHTVHTYTVKWNFTPETGSNLTSDRVLEIIKLIQPHGTRCDRSGNISLTSRRKIIRTSLEWMCVCACCMCISTVCMYLCMWVCVWVGCALVVYLLLIERVATGPFSLCIW